MDVIVLQIDTDMPSFDRVILSWSNFIYCNCGLLAETKLLTCFGTHEVERTVLYRTKSLDGTKPNTNPNPNTNLSLIHI